MDDLIGRQAAIDALIELSVQRDEWDSKEGFAQKRGIDASICAIEDLPSTERRGRWIMHIDDLFPQESTMECDQCHEEQPLECDDKYCPNCGAHMIEEETK